MNYFNSCATKEEAKKLYRELAKKHHPDVGGDNKTMSEISRQYENFVPIKQEDPLEAFQRAYYGFGHTSQSRQKTKEDLKEELRKAQEEAKRRAEYEAKLKAQQEAMRAKSEFEKKAYMNSYGRRYSNTAYYNDSYGQQSSSFESTSERDYMRQKIIDLENQIMSYTASIRYHAEMSERYARENNDLHIRNQSLREELERLKKKQKKKPAKKTLEKKPRKKKSDSVSS